MVFQGLAPSTLYASLDITCAPAVRNLPKCLCIALCIYCSHVKTLAHKIKTLASALACAGK